MRQSALFENPRRWSSDGLEGRQAEAAWLNVFSKNLHEVQADARPIERPFRVRMELYALGGVTASFVETEWGRMVRTRSLIAASQRRDFTLFQPRTGAAHFRLLRGEHTVRPGECILVNTGEPYEMVCPQPTTAVALALPESWLRRWLPRPERSRALFADGEGWSRALCAVVSALRPDSVRQLALSGSAVAENVASLIALAAGPDSQGGPPLLLDSLLATLRSILHEHEISAVRVAERHHISLRKLHYAFASAGTTFMQELVRLRLDHAQELLSDSRLARLGIAAVAARCGFSDPSHFARRFRRRFGLTPLLFRSQALNSPRQQSDSTC